MSTYPRPITPKPKPAPMPKKAKKPIKASGKKRSNGGIKITNPDKWFSLCVRERADWTCQRCGRKFPEEYSLEGLPKALGLDCSHYFGRGNWAVRFDPLNAWAHCRGCHGVFEANPHNFREWMHDKLGDAYDVLVEKSNNRTIGKQARREMNEIAAHYKEEFERMRELRSKGKVGRLNFQGYF